MKSFITLIIVVALALLAYFYWKPAVAPTPAESSDSTESIDADLSQIDADASVDSDFKALDADISTL